MRPNSEQIIQSAIEAGRPASDAQAELRRGFDADKITVGVALSAMSLMIEESLRLSVKLFSEALKLVGAQVNEEAMANAYIQSLRLTQDAFFYDVLGTETGPNTDEDGFVYEATLLGEEG